MAIAPGSEEIGTIPQAIRTGRKMEIKYRDLKGHDSTRTQSLPLWRFGS
jgi:predicted DNA-binding transcriptional regulator YafY